MPSWSATDTVAVFPPGYMDGGRAMGNGRHIGRGALASARQIRHLDHAATRMTVSIGVAVLVVTATVLLAPASTVSPALKLSADYDRLDLGQDQRPDAQRRLRRGRQEPVHRADSSGPGHQLRRGDDARGVLAPHGAALPPPRARARPPGHLGTRWPRVAG